MLSACVLSPFSFSVARAETKDRFLRVIDDGTAFCQDEDCSEPLFFLPYTYYVKILSESETSYQVRYCGDGGIPSLDGYVEKTKLFDDSLSVVNPYPTLKITTSADCPFYSDKTCATPVQYVFAERTLYYYGYLKTNDGSFVYYCAYNDRLGYVKESSVYPFSLPNHSNPLTFIKTEEPEEPHIQPSATDADGVFGLKMAVILCLSFAGIIGLFIAFQPKHRKKNEDYYDENGYE